jgi:hypothetical protein
MLMARRKGAPVMIVGVQRKRRKTEHDVKVVAGLVVVCLTAQNATH